MQKTALANDDKESIVDEFTEKENRVQRFDIIEIILRWKWIVVSKPPFRSSRAQIMRTHWSWKTWSIYHSLVVTNRSSFHFKTLSGSLDLWSQRSEIWLQCIFTLRAKVVCIFRIAFSCTFVFRFYRYIILSQCV